MNELEASRRRIGWRWPLVISFALHVLLVFLFNIMPDVEPEAPTPPLAEWEAPDREMDYMVMDIYETAAPVSPRVVGLAPCLDKPPNSPDPASSAPAPTVAPVQANALGTTAKATSPTENETGNTSQSAGATTPATAGNPEGSTGGTSFFKVPPSARSVVYVIDRSGSMGLGGRLSLAQQELEASLARLPEAVRFQVIGYNRRADFVRIDDCTGLLPATVTNKQTALLWLKSLLPEGATDHVAALKQALLLAPDVIYFLTDAADLKPEQVRALTQLNHSHTAIHTIELTPQRDRHDTPLEQLAHSNHGQYQAVSSIR